MNRFQHLFSISILTLLAVGPTAQALPVSVISVHRSRVERSRKINPPKLIDFSLISYATDASPVSRLSTNLHFETENAELGISAFYETGAKRFWNFDPDPMVLRFSSFWVGRTHPLVEGSKQARPQAREALGLPWVQNQVDPLHPKVSGWMSMGYHGRIAELGRYSKLSVNLAFSPLFIPTFSPSLGLSEQEGLNPERWARLPPTAVEFSSGAQAPIRYRLEMDRLGEVILQNQFFASTTLESPDHRASLMFWSAPSANPVAGVSSELFVSAEEVNARVKVNPKFPRQNFVGAQWVLLPERPLSFDLQLSSELATLATLGSLRVAYRPLQTEAGFLATLLGEAGSPSYADSLVWIQSKLFWLTSGPRTLSSNFRFERHLLTGMEGGLFSASLDYLPRPNLRFSTVGTVLTGSDQSYYGAWRALDTIRVGVSYLW